MHILTTATGYEPSKLEIFARSFRAATVHSKLTIFVDEGNRRGYEVMAGDRITIKSVRQKIYKKQYAGDILADYVTRFLRIRKASDPTYFPACCARYFYYRDFLRDELDRDPINNEVVLTDSRDVFFQRDPDGVPEGKDIVFALEDKKIAEQRANRSWIRRLYGEEVAEELGSETVSCAGTTYGKRDAVLEYLEEMVAEMLLKRKTLCLRPALDQGIHNYVLNRKSFPNTGYNQPIDTQLATIGTIKGLEYRVEGGVVKFRNPDIIPAMIHQFDRHPELERSISAI